MNHCNCFFLLLISLLLLTGCDETNDSTTQENLEQIVQVENLINQSKDKKLKIEKRVELVKKAKDLSSTIDNDSLISQSFLQIIRLSNKLENKKTFSTFYPQAILHSRRVKDTNLIATVHNYVAYHFLEQNNNDSAYYHFYNGSKHFKLLEKDFMTGKMLMNMAIIQKNQHDYIGSEKVSIEALGYLLKTNNKQYISSIYNNLGIISKELMKFPEAIEYHQKALTFRKKLTKKPILQIESLNNIAVAHKDIGDLEIAIRYLDSIKTYKNKILEKNPIVKARVIDNLAHAKLLKFNSDTSVPKELEEALSIRIDENHLSGVMVSYLHLAEYYQLNNSPEKAFEYAKKAKDLSSEHKNYRDVLNALRYLTTTNIERDNTTFIKEYYKISDSLEKSKNLISDHFARIRFESDEKEKENLEALLKIDKQENQIKNRELIIILLISVAILILIILYILIKNNRYKDRLYKEFNHRTRNNLVEIQRGIMKVKKSNERESIYELESTTQSQLLLYSILEQSNHPTHIFIDQYLIKLIESLLLIYPEYQVSFEFEKLTPVKINSKKASLIGLIINEFITNAFKHSFSKGTPNNVIFSVIDLNKTEIGVIISTNGIQWNPKNSNKNGHGIKIMHSLAKKIPARIKISNGDNITSLKLIFSK